jgi:hypothetical protein
MFKVYWRSGCGWGLMGCFDSLKESEEYKDYLDENEDDCEVWYEIEEEK